MNSMINDLKAHTGKVPDLVGSADIRRLTYRTSEGKVDERPVIIDYDSGSIARVLRIMKWAEDAAGGSGERKCCLRFEVQVTKPGRRASHQIGDVVIWSQTLNDVLNSGPIMSVLRRYKVTHKELRASLIRDGFEDAAKTF